MVGLDGAVGLRDPAALLERCEVGMGGFLRGRVTTYPGVSPFLVSPFLPLLCLPFFVRPPGKMPPIATDERGAE